MFPIRLFFFSVYWRYVSLLVILPAADLFVLSFFGWYVTLASMLVGGCFGVLMIRLQGLYVWNELKRQLDRGEVPAQPALHGVLLLAAGFLMTMPGLLTDMIGLFLLFPLTRMFVVSYIILRLESHRLTKPPADAPDIIEIK